MNGRAENLRLLRPGDEAALDAFLREHAASSMFLRSNLRAGGVEDRGEVHQARYAGLFLGVGLVAVAAHCWNGSLLLQAPISVERVAAAAVGASGRSVRWLLGPAAQVEAVRRSPLLAGRAAARASIEELMRLNLDRLRVPPALGTGQLRCRRGTAGDYDRLTQWRIAYEEEAFCRAVTPALEREARSEMEARCSSGALFVLESAQEPVAMCGFNARLPDTVQLGGVFTPRPLRAQGFGRAVAAGALLAAREEAATTAILFTGVENAPALRAYRSLGFERVGDYALALFEG